MCAAAFDFVAERGFIAASDDPNQLFDWMSDYDQRRRAAKAEGDDDEAAQFEELRQEAEDRVVELKAARLRRVERRPAALEPVVRPVAEAPPRREVERHAAAQEVPTPTVDPLAVAQAEPARRRAAEEAAARKAAEEAEAAAERASDEELRQLQERAANAKARRQAALAATARIEAEAKRAAAEAAREQARRGAAKEVEDEERKAAEAEAAARVAAMSGAKPPPVPPLGPPKARVVDERPRPKGDEPTPLALLFQERLTEVLGTPTETLPAPRPPTTPPAARAAAPASPVPSRPPIPAKVAAPPPAPVDDLPALTGADLASYRTWLGASQRALAAKLAVEQSVISKSEGKPTTVLPPQLRKALHLAMQEPRDAARGAS